MRRMWFESALEHCHTCLRLRRVTVRWTDYGHRRGKSALCGDCAQVNPAARRERFLRQVAEREAW